MNDNDLLELDEDTENVGMFLTLLVKEVNPKINLGMTYELLIDLLLRIQNDSINEDDAITCGREILATKDKPTQLN